jgi:hypothetical protein
MFVTMFQLNFFPCKNENKSNEMSDVVNSRNSFKLIILAILPYLQFHFYGVCDLILSHVTVLNILGTFHLIVTRGIQQVV